MKQAVEAGAVDNSPIHQTVDESFTHDSQAAHNAVKFHVRFCHLRFFPL
jgi:hypothetical protein